MIGQNAIRSAGRRRFSGAAAFVAEAVVFDGTNDYMKNTTGMGASDNKTFTVSFWIYTNSQANQTLPFCFGTDGTVANFRGYIQLQKNGLVSMVLKNASGTSIMQTSTALGIITTGAWQHVIVSIDLANTSNRYMYVDDTSISVTWNPYTNDNIDVSANNWTIGDWFGGGQKVNADLAELYVTNEYIDLSVQSNREKFISSAGAPVDLGSDGSTPTGTAALLYMKGVASVWNAGTNAGSGGNFTMTGAVADSSNEPVELP